MINISNTSGSQNLMSYCLRLQIDRNELNKMIRDAVKKEFEIARAKEELEKWINGFK